MVEVLKAVTVVLEGYRFFLQTCPVFDMHRIADRARAVSVPHRADDAEALMAKKIDTLTIKSLVVPVNDTNIYVVIDGREAGVIDSHPEVETVMRVVENAGARLKYVLVTHAHRSHIQSLDRYKNNGEVKVCMHENDGDLMTREGQEVEPDILFKDGMSLPLGGSEISVLHTPGHTMGSVCLYLRSSRVIFTGDTLLKGEFGKIWGPHSMGLMLRSLKRLNSIIPPKTVIYPGHGPATTMSAEAWLDPLDNLS